MPGFLWPLALHITQEIHNWTLLGNSTCEDGVKWIYTVFGQCVLDTIHYASIILGIVSIVAFVLQGMPQMVQNCRTGKAHQAVSIYMILFWTMGDSLNLAGCLLTHQLPLQSMLAVFSIGCDIILLSQWLVAYIRDRQWRRSVHADVTSVAPSVNGTDDSGGAVGSTFCACVATVWLVGCGAAYNQLHPESWASSSPPQTGRRLLYIQPLFTNTQDLVGYTMGCGSCCCYLSSRIPQLTKNFLRRTTEGLSIALFFLALLGNGAYSAQIFLTSTDDLFLLRHFPWIMGSLGVMVLDFIMLGQFFAFRKRAVQLLNVRLDAEEQQSLIYS